MTIRPPMRRVALALAAALASALAPGRALAQDNPVYVDDSPRAWEIFRLARDQAADNEGEAVRLYQELLDEYGQKLIPRRENDRDHFVGVRSRVLADLRGSDSLLERYRSMQSAEAERRLESGEEEGLAATRSLTAPGLEALLRLGQQALESARFHEATARLEEAADHPDLDLPRAAHCWYMLGVAARYLDRPERLGAALQALEDLGPDGRAALEELRRLAAEGDGPAIARGVSPLDGAEASDLGDLVAQTIWSVELTDSLARRRFPDAAPGEPDRRSAPGQARRRTGDWGTAAATVAGNVVFVNEGHRVHALDRFTGRSVWSDAFVDRDGTLEQQDDGVGDLNVVAVTGDTLVTLTGHAHAAGRSGDGRVVCLDAATGRERWARRLDRIEDDDEYEGLFPHGAPVIGEDAVFVLARKETRQMVTSCYLLALDLEHGGLRWIRHVASSGGRQPGRPFSTPLLAGGRIYVASSVGAIACVEAASGSVRWLHRWNVPVRTRIERKPWEMVGPVIAGDRLLALTPDQRRVVVLDLETGDEIASHDAGSRERWNAPSYLLARGDRVFAVGREIRAFDPGALERPLWSFPAAAVSAADGPGWIAPDAAEIVGRVQCVGDVLLVPTSEGLHVVDHETGRTTHTLALEAAGNPVAVDAQLVYATPDSLDVYMSLTRAEEILRRRLARAPDDPEPAMSLLQLGMRVGDLALALEAAELSLQAIQASPDEARASEARRELFEMLIEIHASRMARGAREAEALYGMIGAVAETVEQRIEHLLSYGDWQAAAAPGRAVETYQAVLSDPVLAHVSREETSVWRPAAVWAARRLRDLIDEHGEAIYGPQSDYARRSLAHLIQPPGPDDAALVALALEFPFAPAGLDAAVIAADRARARGDDRAALAVLLSSWHLSADPARGRRLLGRAVEIDLERGRDGHARRLLEGIARVHGNVELETNDGSRRARQWLAELDERAPAQRRPRIGTRHDAGWVLPGRLVPVSPWTAGGAEALPTDRALLIDGSEVSLCAGPRLEPLWTSVIDDPDAQLLRFGPQILLWTGSDQVGDRRVVALDAANGTPLWSTSRLDDLLEAPLARGRGLSTQIQMPDTIPFDPRETIPLVEGGVILLVQRTGGVAAFGADDGAPRWTADRTIEQVHLALAHPWGLVLAGVDRVLDARSGNASLQPRVVIIDHERGVEVHRLRPQTTSGAIWMTADAPGSLVLGSSEGIEAIDLLSGRRRWSNLSSLVGETHRAWLAGRHVVVESRTRGSLFSIRIEDGAASPPFDMAVRGQFETPDLADVHADDGLILARYSGRIIRYDPEGNVVGADIVSEPTRDYRALLRGVDRMVVLSLLDSRQIQVEGGRRKQWTYRVYILSEDCKLEGDSIELPPRSERVRDHVLLDGRLLLSTDAATLVLLLPPS